MDSSLVSDRASTTGRRDPQVPKLAHANTSEELLALKRRLERTEANLRERTLQLGQALRESQPK